MSLDSTQERARRLCLRDRRFDEVTVSVNIELEVKISLMPDPSLEATREGCTAIP